MVPSIMPHPRPAILVVDDEVAILEALTFALADRYVVHTAVCAADALAILHVQPIALIVLDLTLQEKRGLELIAAIRRVSPARILILNGQRSEAVAAQALWARADCYLPKPVPLPTLRAAVDRLMAPSASPLDLATRARQCLESYPPKPLHLAELAHQLGVSDAHLQRLFRMAHGRTPRRYLMECRLQQAATMLRRTSNPIESIAATLGFPSSTRFARAFRAVMGMTPSEYRAWVRARSS